jgi:hypothetical protein
VMFRSAFLHRWYILGIPPHIPSQTSFRLANFDLHFAGSRRTQGFLGDTVPLDIPFTLRFAAYRAITYAARVQVVPLDIPFRSRSDPKRLRPSDP